MNMMISGLLLTTFINIFIAHFVSPRTKIFFKRPWSSMILEVSTWLLFYALFLILFRRVYFVSISLIGLEVLLIMVHEAKFYSMKEAFIFQDFEYFSDAIKHPRLYLPFFGLWRTFLASCAFLLAVIAGFKYEATLSFLETFTFGLPILIFTSILIKFCVPRLPKISIIPNNDLLIFGQIAFFWAYWFAERNQKIDFSNSIHLKDFSKKNKKQHLKDIVVIQSESFFDPRKLLNAIDKKVLAGFEELCSESALHGELKVPAFGAETVRTECAFLTGLEEKYLGVHKFNPYRQMSKESIPNLISSLKKMGYKTICIHPYSASFYKRNKVFPLMGFDEFIDISEFNVEKTGQYIGDMDVFEKIKLSLNKADKNKPLFIFVITMENHGPLNLEKPSDKDRAFIKYEKYDSEFDDLLVYLKHLKNGDLMISQLRKFLLKRKSIRHSLFCFYGDHVPIMPKVYNKIGQPDGKTEFFIWDSSDNIEKSKFDPQECRIENLGSQLISKLYC